VSTQNPFEELWQQFKKGSRPQQALTFLRVMTGAYFLYQGMQKFNNPQFASTLGGTLQQWAAHNPIIPYKNFLLHFAIPNASHLAQWVTDGELAVGFSYVLGLFVSASAPLAVFLNLNFLLAAQHMYPGLLEINAGFIVISFILYWGETGRYFGLDALRTKAPGTKPATTFGKKDKKLEAVTNSLKKAKEEEASKSGGKKNIKTRINPF
jgi:uncharacterized membrane protein YphA (DoxX/SURF4 family)